jgi:Ca2+-binding RTX toxin-like protein
MVEWNLAGAELNPADDNSTFGTVPTVQMSDVSLDASAFLKALNESFITPTLQVAGPIFEVCDKLATPLPVVGDILANFGLGGTLIDVFAGPGSAAAESVKAIANFGNFLESAQKIAASGKLDLGTFTFGSSDIRDPFFSLGAVQPSVVDFGLGIVNGALSAFANAASAIPGLAFPILQTEGEIFKMVLGQAANIVTYDAAPITFGVSESISFPLFFGINGRVGFAANGKINLGLGYDTSGLAAFASSGDLADLASGFFLKDYGANGAEIPEAQFSAQITAGVGAGIPGLFEVGVEGCIRGMVNYESKDFIPGRADLANDRKISYGELAEVCFNPFAVADISGRIDAFLSFFVESLVYSKSKDLGAITLFDFDTAANQAQGFANIALASKNSGELLIHTGENAGLRSPGQTDVSESIRIEAAGKSLRVSSPKVETLSNVELPSLGGSGKFDGVSKIKVLGGAGEDVISINALVKKPALIVGGPGADSLTGGAGADKIVGGEEADRIIGGGGNDELFGDDRVLFGVGPGGADVISGLEGHHTIEGGPGRDEIRGGPGNDLIYGYVRISGEWVKASDTGDDLFGGEGADVLLGSDGNDTLNGGTGVDAIYGAGGSDTFHVDNPKDAIFSDAPQNQIVESTAANFKLPTGFNILYLVGRYDEDNDVTRHEEIGGEGNSGNNLLFGNRAANVLIGNGGNDSMFGDLGDDFLLGGDGDDSLFAFGGTNTLRGGNGNDYLYGGPGVDALEGGSGDDVYVTDNFAEISDTGGIDAVSSKVSVNLADNPAIEGVYLTGGANINATGTNADAYWVDSAKAVIIEDANPTGLLQDDVVLARSSFTLPANVEHLALIGPAAKSGNGNDQNNTINAGGLPGVRALLTHAVTLDGRGGNDDVIGGDGADKIFGGDGNDIIAGFFRKRRAARRTQVRRDDRRRRG